jgi:hypothetical protein
MPEPSYEERYMLTLNRVLNKHARLGCPVILALKHQNKICNVDIRLNSDSNIVTTFTINELMKLGLKGMFSLVVPDQRSGKDDSICRSMLACVS